MKKFIAISIVLILVSASVFGISLYHFVDTSKDEATPSQQATEAIATKDEAPTQASLTNTKMPAEFNDGGIFSENYDKAYDYVSKMSTEQKVGQMILGSCPLDETADTMMTKYALSGYVYKSDNFTLMTADDIRTKMTQYQSNASTPMIMAVKEEGGAVTTISDLDTFSEYDFSSVRDVFARGGMDEIKSTESEKAKMLSSCGINLNLAPVCDMAEDMTQIMYSRSLGGTVDDVCEFAKNVTEISQSNSVSVALKHFPGYGTTPDTMDYIVVDTREATVFEETDYKPFIAGADAGAHFVMVSNALVQNLDPNCVASLSESIHKTLREKIGFTGLCITDNLNNSDYTQYANGKDVYVQAVLAQNDMLYVDNIEEAYMAILSAVKDGTIEQDLIDKACTRIIAYKYTAGIMK